MMESHLIQTIYHEILWETKLSELKTMKPEDVATSLERHNLIDGIKSGETDYLHVLFSFEDNEQDRNKFRVIPYS